MALREGEWRLTYRRFGRLPAGDLTFGSLASGYDLMQPPEITLGDIEAGDAPLPLEDGVRHGLDTEGAGSIQFQINVDTADLPVEQRYAANMEALGKLREVWRADAVRNRPGAIATLETVSAGRTRVVYGRPRRYAPGASRLTRKGHTPVLAEFVISDGRFYGLPAPTRTITSAVAPTGGIKTPLITPLTTVQFASSMSDLVVTGHALTWPIITIRGPISQPRVTIAGQFEFGLDMRLGDGEAVTIDPRPWARTMTMTGGGSVSGFVSRRSPRLSDMLLNPGAYDVTLGGVDATGLARVEIAHSPAYGWL